MWRVRVYQDGKEVASRWCDRKDAAQKLEQKLLRELEQEEEENKEKAPTLAQFWPEFVRYAKSSANPHGQWRASTEATQTSLYTHHLRPALGDRRLDRITQRDVDRLRADLDGVLASSTAGAVLQVLRHMLRIAKGWELISSVPAIPRGCRRSDDQIENDKWLTRNETDRLVAAADAQWRAVIIVAVRTGLRIGELRELRWGDVTAEQLHVRRSYGARTGEVGPTKNGKSRAVPLCPDALAALATLAQGGSSDLVFRGGGEEGRLAESAYVRRLQAAAKRAGISKHVHPHMMRHTWASHCIAAGIPTRVVMAWGGWASEDMLRRYAHLAPSEVAHYIHLLGGIQRGGSAPDPRPDPRIRQGRDRGRSPLSGAIFSPG
jgi:integrase